MKFSYGKRGLLVNETSSHGQLGNYKLPNECVCEELFIEFLVCAIPFYVP